MKRYLIFALTVIPTLLLCFAIGLRIGVKNHAVLGGESRADAAKAQIQKWNAEEYVPIDNSDGFRKRIFDIAITNNASSLSDGQKDALRNSIYSFLMAYSQGDYQVYRQFRLCAPGSFNARHLDYAKQYIFKAHPDGPALSDPNEIFNKYVELRSNGAYYKSYLKSVNILSDGVMIEESVIKPQMLGEYVMNSTTNLGVAVFDPMFIYDRSTSKILQEDGKLLYATVGFLVKTEEPNQKEMPTPVYVRWNWDKQSSKWLPSEMAMGSIKQQSKIVMIF
jgi:hypothetical protein